MVCILHGYYDARPKMCFSASPPPPPKAIFSSNLTFGYECSINNPSVHNTKYHYQNCNNNNTVYKEQYNMQRQEDITSVNDSQRDEETSSDYKQWLHAMKLVARLPGGIPPEFRRKLWLSLADKYLKSKNVDWAREEEKCFCEKWREDDEELGIQIVKDLHRTGSTLCTGPAGDLNQAKLKKILLGYARYNPEVGYCQGFNMLGALILQVMDKDESESIKVMIYLVEGILPAGYFCGSMGGLQADMAVFRELMQTKLPRLAKHLQKLQGPIENAYEPPLTNVFTMQWFLTMFCTCLPMSCVLRVWDLVLIEGSDVLLRTALALWSLLEERVLSARSADDFYGKMGSFSSELLNGHLIDSNGLIEKVVQLGPIADIQKLRDKHLYSIAPIQNQQGLQLYYDDEEPDIDEDSRLAVATVWGIPWGRRGSQGQQNNIITKQPIENKDRIALDISLLKKQYDKLRERQKQAHIILTTACSTASRQSVALNSSTATLPVNQLLSGRPAIVTNKGRRCGPPTGAIPPARKPSLPAVLHDKPLEKQLRRGETLHWRDTKDTRHRRDSLSWKEIKAERAAMITSGSIDGLKSQKIRTGRLGKSDSSSYSEESDDNEAEVERDGSSTDTSLCDEEFQPIANGLKQHNELSQKPTSKPLYKQKNNLLKQRHQSANRKDNNQKARPKSWAPSNSEIPFVLMSTDSPNNSADENPELEYRTATHNTMLKEEEDNFPSVETKSNLNQTNLEFSIQSLSKTMPKIGSTEEKDIFMDSTNYLGSNDDKEDEIKTFDISNEGVTNEYFERVNSSERPTKLDLLYSLNVDENIRDTIKIEADELVKPNQESYLYTNENNVNSSKNIRCMDLLVDYSEKSSVACIEEAKSEISTTFHACDMTVSIPTNKEYFDNSTEHSIKKTKGSAEKRRDPRRLTLTRSSTMDIEKRYQALEKRLSMEVCSKYKRILPENEFESVDSYKKYDQSCTTHPNNINDDDLNNHQVVDNKLQTPKDKKIPSTAELEERFKNIHQHILKDRNELLNSPCDSENTEKQSNMKTPDNDNINKKSTNKKTDRDTKKQDDQNDNNGEAEIANIIGENSDSEPKFLTFNKIEDVNANRNINTPQTSRNPNSQIIAPKTNALQTKKEPPDDNADEDTNSINRTAVATTNNSTAEIEPTAKNSEESEYVSEEKIRTPNSEKNHETVNEIQDDSKSKSNRTSPPSTEELEKRFSALEGQMSNAHIQDDKDTKSNVSLEETEKYGVNALMADNKESSDTQTLTTDTSNNCMLSSLDIKTDLTKLKQLSEKNTKRRLSEPPTTEDLEKRYEVLKRRMSSRNFETRSFPKDGFSDSPQKTREISVTESSTNLKSTDITPHSASKSSPPSIENLEERFEKLQNKNESKSSFTKHSPPSTETLEKRFEELQSKNGQLETQKSTNTEVNNKETQILPTEKEQLSYDNNTVVRAEKNEEIKNSNSLAKETISNPTPNNIETCEDGTQTSNENDISDKKEHNNITDDANQIKVKLIKELQAKIKGQSINSDIENSVQKKTALIEELKIKIKPMTDMIVKPTHISTSRRPPVQSFILPSQSFNDETLESHATSAYSRSGKYEPSNTSNRKMVRRFSDLPSRADLENRLQFLEEQLSKTVCMQRRSSDSEVASKSRHNVPLSDSLEYRVQELEKRLNENRSLSTDVEHTNTKEKIISEPNVEISQIELATDSVAVTGKELVRYSSYGEVGDTEHQNPINISINIQMTLNKDDTGNKKNPDVTKTDELDRRLQYLEKQLKSSQDQETFENAATDVKECINGKEQKDLNETDNTHQFAQTEEFHEIKDISETADVKILQETNRNNTITPLNINQSSVIAETDEIAENLHKENVLEKSKEEKSDHKVEKFTDNEGTLGQVNKTTECSENNFESTMSKVSDPGEKTQKLCSDTQKHNLTEVDEQVNKDNLKSDLPKSPDKPTIASTAAEPKQNILNKNKNHPNAIEAETQIDKIKDDGGELLEYNSQSTPQSNNVAESSQLDLIEGENIQKHHNSENIKESEIDSSNVNTSTQFVPVEVNKKTLVLLLDNEPKAVKVRRLTRANTEELEDLFQALEKQLTDRGQGKHDEKNPMPRSNELSQDEIETTKAMSELAKDIEEFSKSKSDQSVYDDKLKQTTKKKQKELEEDFDWGNDPIKYHLKKRTVYLPSTKELEARFRSLERQIKLLEDVEKIDVEQRLIEIERKIKLQYSLSHEKDLNKFLELCEGKDVDEIPTSSEDQKESSKEVQVNQKSMTKHTSPSRQIEPTPSTGSLEYRYRALDLKRSKSKQNLKKQPIHPLEMLLDPSPDDIPTTGELEHRMRVMEENRYTPSPPSRKSRSQSPPAKSQQNKNNSNIHILETMTASPTERELPTAEELEARLEALEREQCFNFKMQKNFQQFNQKLKDVVSPSLSFDEFKASTKSCESDHSKVQSLAPKQITSVNTFNPKTIRFRKEDQSQLLPKKDNESVTFADSQSNTKGSQQTTTAQEGLGVMGIRLMRETSPLRRKGTHTGIPLRTGENINDQLTSIQNTIKSIDSLCEEKPYRKERCQQYIDALFSDSKYFAHKKSSLEDLTSRNLSRSTSREIGPSIRISDHSPAFSRSMGSADSIRSSSPLGSSSPLQYRSNRDLRREPSPRRRRDEDREEHESRVRRDNLLPNNINYSHSILSHTSHSSLTKFHKVDSQLIPNDVEHELEDSLRTPTFRSTDNSKNDNTNTSNNVYTTPQRNLNAEATNPEPFRSLHLDRPISPFRQTILPSTNTPVYTPAKLEIRHTTVTSTFYDRVLTEKQLEKQNHHSVSTNSLSPIISPLFEKHAKPSLKQQTNKSPPKLLHTDSTNTH
ncbi:uncharacterized protein LOC111690890 isoform X3 [Lucilia cuprina]|uniref:uncharacterized protein LOC111690890 isoform X3 n=1 Tax=Lucilia cuprina TaxID=7375 RepID=UPI001F050642|nr:uncharacterized protein LOC111690890 isoform X3 [Lucilia cuprina]XP_046804043.1 uncharacterized protein LOC111690890 isoform X3 [Lucilia cuprina]